MNKNITYYFKLKTGAEHRFDVDLDRPVRSGEGPAWTLLASDKCPNCPLGDDVARCPAAVDLVPLIERFSALASIDKVDVRVVTAQHEARKDTDSQTALSALMGLILATSGCPILGRMHPLAQTHMPFATPTEVVYRMASMHIFGCFLEGQPANLQGLERFFADIDTLNHAFARRLKRALESDAGINALVMLHSRAMLASLSIEAELETIRGWYQRTDPN
ncbi:MAG: DUF6901 family protein [Burkholderiales bacterium]